MKTIGVIGSRRRVSLADYQATKAALLNIYREGDRLVSGGCPSGGDLWCEQFARLLGATITIHHANWRKYGKRAGFQRNGKIAADADVLIACVAADRTGGTEDTIEKFLSPLTRTTRVARMANAGLAAYDDTPVLV